MLKSKLKRVLSCISAAAVAAVSCFLPTVTTLSTVPTVSAASVDNSTMEKLIDDGRAVVGYFASWRKNELGGYYTYKDLPWGKLTTINYAFGSVGEWGDGLAHHFKTSATDTVGKEWDGTEEGKSGLYLRDGIPQIVPPKNYKCWFADSDKDMMTELVKYKNSVSPRTRIVLSVGGWASSGEFYPLVNAGEAAWQEFADSAVDIIRTFKIDGVDIDFEHPSTVGSATAGGLAGNPQNFSLSEVGTNDASVYINYVGFMRTLNNTIDKASAADGKQYLLTAAGSASGWVLRGEALSEYCQTLDYINIMSYDFHGAWNKFVWHQSPLYGINGDPEIADAAGYQNYLSVDWAVRYYEGAMPSQRINIGIPYYTRGWVDVSGGTNGLGGTTPHPIMTPGKAGEATVDKTDAGVILLNSGADGVDGLWNDPAPELPAGANSMYHMKNLLEGIVSPAMQNILKHDWGYSDSEVDAIVARVKKDFDNNNGYKEFYDSNAKVAYIWNAAQKTFHTYENEQSITDKCNYILDNNLGGYMTWEFSGDWSYDESAGVYTHGTTLTDLAANLLSKGSKLPPVFRPEESQIVDFTWNSASNLLDNYPAQSLLIITNNTGKTIQMEKDSLYPNADGIIEKEQSADQMTIEFDVSNTNSDKSNWLDNGWASLGSAPTGYTKNADGSLHVTAKLAAWFMVEDGKTTDMSAYDKKKIGFDWSYSRTNSPCIKSVAFCTPFAIKNLSLTLSDGSKIYSKTEYGNPLIDLVNREPIVEDPDWVVQDPDDPDIATATATTKVSSATTVKSDTLGTGTEPASTTDKSTTTDISNDTDTTTRGTGGSVTTAPSSVTTTAKTSATRTTKPTTVTTTDEPSNPDTPDTPDIPETTKASTTKPTTTAKSSTAPSGDHYYYGDANLDGSVDILDVVIIQAIIVTPDSYPIYDTQLISDIDYAGGTPSIRSLIIVKQRLAGWVDALNVLNELGTVEFIV